MSPFEIRSCEESGGTRHRSMSFSTESRQISCGRAPHERPRVELIALAQAFTEYKDVTVTDPLRQGDVIEATDSRASKWKRHLLVITADCDFANAKHQGRVTCVPLLSQDEYLMEFQISRVRDRVINKLVSSLHSLLVATDAPTISLGRLRQWPSEQEPAVIVRTLGLRDSHAEEAQKLLAAIRAAAHPATDLDDAVDRLVRAQVDIPNGKKAANAKQGVVDALKSHYTNPPGDALFLSAIAPNLNTGYFVYLRHLEQIRQPDIAIGPSRNVVGYRRLARLQDRFIHAVSQQFALVFMAIGLPHDYEELRNLHSELLGERYI
jgi:hypothetical protein